MWSGLRRKRGSNFLQVQVESLAGAEASEHTHLHSLSYQPATRSLLTAADSNVLELRRLGEDGKTSLRPYQKIKLSDYDLANGHGALFLTESKILAISSIGAEKELRVMALPAALDPEIKAANHNLNEVPLSEDPSKTTDLPVEDDLMALAAPKR